MSNIILFDLDHTLINTNQLFEEGFHQPIFGLVKRPPEEVRPILNRYWEQFNHPQEFEWAGYAEHLAKELAIDLAQVTAILHNESAYQAAVYPDAEMTLTELQSRGYEFGIWSEGDPAFQHLKVTASGLSHWFRPELMFISRNKIAPEVLESLPEATVIDDRLRVLEPLAATGKCLPIWLNRWGDERPATWQQRPMVTQLHQVTDFL